MLLTSARACSVVLLVGALLVAGCGSSDEQSASGGGATSTRSRPKVIDCLVRSGAKVVQTRSDLGSLGGASLRGMGYSKADDLTVQMWSDGGEDADDSWTLWVAAPFETIRASDGLDVTANLRDRDVHLAYAPAPSSAVVSRAEGCLPTG